MQALLALSPLIIRALKVIVPVMIGLLLLPIIVASAVLNKSAVVWPVVAPTQVAAGQTEYLATRKRRTQNVERRTHGHLRHCH
jgi:hypothetical protein